MAKFKTDSQGWPLAGCPLVLHSGPRAGKSLTRPQAIHLTTLIRLIYRDGLPMHQVFLGDANEQVMDGLVAKGMVELEWIGRIRVLKAFTRHGLRQVLQVCPAGSGASLELTAALMGVM